MKNAAYTFTILGFTYLLCDLQVNEDVTYTFSMKIYFMLNKKKLTAAPI